MKACPACGEHTIELHEGYCAPCQRVRQDALDLHNSAFDRWSGMTDAQREAEIRWHIR